MTGKTGREPKQAAKQERDARKTGTAAPSRSKAESTGKPFERPSNPTAPNAQTADGLLSATPRRPRPTAKGNVRITSSQSGALAPVGVPSENDLAAYVQEVRTALEETVVQGIVRRAQRGAALIPAKELARRMLAVAPAPVPRSRMAEQVGPDFYDTNGVATVLSANRMAPVSKQAIEQRRNRQTILALQTQDGRWVYPTWQFQDGDVAAAVVRVLHAFRDSAAATEAQRHRDALTEHSATVPAFSNWSVATWLTTARNELAGRTYAEVLLEGTDASAVEAVLARARHTAATWAA